MFCSLQIRLLSIKYKLLSIFFPCGFQFIPLWILENLSWIQGLLVEANSLVSVTLREYRVYFF